MINKELTIWSLRDQQIFQELLQALAYDTGPLEYVETKKELISRRITYMSENRKFYTVLVFESKAELLRYMDCRPVEDWIEHVLVAFSLGSDASATSSAVAKSEDFQWNFHKKATAVYAINLGAVIPQGTPIAIKEMALLYQGALLDVETELGKQIYKIAQTSGQTNEKLIPALVQEAWFAQMVFKTLGQDTGLLKLAETKDDWCSRRITYRSANEGLYSIIVFPSRTDLKDYIDYYWQSDWQENAVVAMALRDKFGSFSGQRTKGNKDVYILNLGASISKTAPAAIRELALLCQGALFEPETELGAKIIEMDKFWETRVSP